MQILRLPEHVLHGDVQGMQSRSIAIVVLIGHSDASPQVSL